MTRHDAGRENPRHLLRLASTKILLTKGFEESSRTCDPRHRAFNDQQPRLPYALRLSGTLPPLSASFTITCLCSQTFISAEPSRAPV